MTEVVFGTCPKCKGDTFRLYDKDPSGDYPQPRLECQGCGAELHELELQGIEWIKAPF